MRLEEHNNIEESHKKNCVKKEKSQSTSELWWRMNPKFFNDLHSLLFRLSSLQLTVDHRQMFTFSLAIENPSDVWMKVSENNEARQQR